MRIAMFSAKNYERTLLDELNAGYGPSTVIPDDVIQRLVSLPNVILTGHQAFVTREALRTILDTTLASISDLAAGRPLANEIRR